MLLRRFIPGSNAIEEIYIVKTENASDSEEVTNEVERKFGGEKSVLPDAGNVAPEDGLLDAKQIKTEPQDSLSVDNDPIMVLDVADLAKVEQPDVSKTEDDSEFKKTITELKGGDDMTSPEIVAQPKLDASDEDSNESSSRDRAESNSNDVDNDEDSGFRNMDSDVRRCYICVQHHDSHEALMGHLKQEHSDKLPFECDQCAGAEVKNLYALNKHFAMHDPDRPYTCGICSARFLSQGHRTSHRRRYHKDELLNDYDSMKSNRRFVCRYCNKKFAAKFNLERHEMNHEVKITDDEAFLNRRNKCYLCDRLCDSKQQLHEHLSVHADRLPYQCDKCVSRTVTITSVRVLNKHLSLHEEEKTIKCLYCDERFISITECHEHERTHDQQRNENETAALEQESSKLALGIIVVNGVRRFVCRFCGNSYSLLSTLRRHENIHTGQKQYICKVCGKIFNKSSCLLQHERTHSRNAPYKCEMCGKGFKETIRLIEHRRIHSGEKPFQCPNCHKRFRIKPLLKEHVTQCFEPDIQDTFRCKSCSFECTLHRDMLKHLTNSHSQTIKETQCRYCDLRFKNAVYLAEHEYNHRRPNTIECKQCGRIFKQQSNLRRHLRLHTDDSVPYTCDLCGKSFSQAGAMKVHRRIHTGEKPYACDLCSRTFYHSSTMNRHKRSHYKTSSKLFLFGASETEEAGTGSGKQEDVTSGTTDGEVAAPVQAVPIMATTAAVGPAVLIQQQSSVQLHTTTSYGLSTTAGTVEAVTLPLSTSQVYLLDTKVLIPQAVVQHPSLDGVNHVGMHSQ